MPVLFSNAKRKALQGVLRESRKKSGLSQLEVAERLGRHQSFVSKYESGERKLDLVELSAVCQTLGLTLQEFVERFEEAGS
jgi:transcriptional regulator with XRE-family HTH domain